jgi:hypothetical protein
MNAALLALVAALGTPAHDETRLDACLVNDGSYVKLDHILLVQNGNEEGLEDGPHLRIFITNGVIPLSVAGAATTLEAAAFAKETKIYGIVILADSAGRSMDGKAYNLNLPPPAKSASDNCAAKTPDPHMFQQFRVNGERASGQLVREFGRGHVTAVFDAPITPDPVTQDLSGSDAIESAPGKVYVAYAQAALSGDMAALSGFATPLHARQVNALHSQMGDTAFKQWLAASPNMASLPNSITRVVIRGNSASVVSRGKEFDSLVFDGTSWKVTD